MCEAAKGHEGKKEVAVFESRFHSYLYEFTFFGVSQEC
jgi:hypothetical protein